jgi:pSer/pThr/pTyr-binding forkhead associated (FHA) protein
VQHPFLTMRGGSSHGVVIHIRKPVTTVGRHHNADVVVDDPSISRRHAEITLSGDGYTLSDLGSKNSTFVNQVNIGKSQHRLEDGDEISFGPSQVALTFRNVNLDEVVRQDAKVTESLKWSRLVVFRRDE